MRHFKTCPVAGVVTRESASTVGIERLTHWRPAKPACGSAWLADRIFVDQSPWIDAEIDQTPHGKM